MSGLALGWVRKRRDWPSREAKSLAMYLADNANDQTAWPSIGTLAEDIMCSERTVIRLLAEAVAAGLLIRMDVEDKATGRTRTCGYYFPVFGRPPSPREIAWFEREVGGRVTRVTPWEGDTGGAQEGDTGDRGRVTPVSPLEPPLEPSVADAPSAGEGARAARIDEAWDRIKSAMPARWLAVTDQPAVRDRLEGLVEAGVDLAVLPGCVARFAADPLFTGRKVPEPLEKWLARGGWEGWLDAVDAAHAESHPPGGLEGEPVPAAVVAAVGATGARDGEIGSYLSPARVRAAGGRVYLVALTGVAREWLAEPRRWAAIEHAWAGPEVLRLIKKSDFEALLVRAQETA